MKSFTVGCSCGAFEQHLDIVSAMVWLADHPTGFMCTDTEYYRRLAETLPAGQEAAS